MFSALYIEEEIAQHPLAQRICQRYSQIPHVSCHRYGEVFNRKAQNFRLQKQNPALILAKKFDHFVLETPQKYGIGGGRNYYFSHMLNCPFDCRYCFLQGMYRSAHHVLFVNYLDFQQAIQQQIRAFPEERCDFFSGYDCDSLALEPVTQFVKNFLPFFSQYPHAYLELRTKSTSIAVLLNHTPLSNVVVAYSLTPKEIGKAFEHKTPPLHRRLQAIQKLQKKGWPVGLRFDPIIYTKNFLSQYRQFFRDVFDSIDTEAIHSVSLGPFRLPKGVFGNITRLYPDEKLFMHSLDEKQEVVSYHKALEKNLLGVCSDEILNYIPEEKFFPCEVGG